MFLEYWMLFVLCVVWVISIAHMHRRGSYVGFAEGHAAGHILGREAGMLLGSQSVVEILLKRGVIDREKFREYAESLPPSD